MSKSPTITLGNLAKEIHFVILDAGNDHYGWLDSNFLWPPVSGVSSHSQLHSITSVLDHIFPGGIDTFLSGNGTFQIPVITFPLHNALSGLDGGEPGDYQHLTSGEVSTLHVRSHAITGTSDHTSSATPGKMLKADASGLPIQATNTDAQVAAAVAHMTISNVTIVTGTANILVTYETVICDSTTAFTVTLPIAVVGQYFYISNINTGTVTIQGAGGTDTIDGLTSQLLVQWDTVRVQCYALNKWKVQ
jgi:hypothetical protein